MWQSAGKFVICQPCNCLEPQYKNGRFGNLLLHSETQDTNCDAWKLLESLVETAARKRSAEFSPGLEMPPELWSQIITLPRSLAKLTSVKRLYLYGSNLVRIPPEIGAMESLEELDIYTSYRLHWLPYEVTRCQKLKRSRASTRALYGNYKYRPLFPRLGDGTQKPASLRAGAAFAVKVFLPSRRIRFGFHFVLQRMFFPSLCMLVLWNASGNFRVRQKVMSVIHTLAG